MSAAGWTFARPWHAVTWLWWALAATFTVQLAPSPVYVVLIIGIAALVVQVHAPDGPFARAFPALVTLGAVFALVRVVISAATTHIGGTGHILFATPSFTMPQLLGGFTVGGTVELPVILQSAADGLTIVGVMAVFGAFNAVASHDELVQSAPRAFHELGLVLTVALAFVPSTLQAVAASREADRARTGGRVVRRGRLLRQVVPVLESGMERAVTLAESMDARGFAHLRADARARVGGWCSFASLLALGGAFVALIGRARGAAIAFGVAGTVALVLAIRLGSAGARLRYRPRRMTAADRGVVAVVLVAPLATAALALAGDHTLTWVANPLRWPGFDPLAALAIAALLAPLVRRPSEAAARARAERVGQHDTSDPREMALA